MSITTLRRLFVMYTIVGSPLLASSFAFPDFHSTTGLTLIGSAVPAANALQLTPDMLWSAGAAIYSERQEVAAGFTTTFSFSVLSSGAPADGFVFLVENVAPWFSQPAGGALDYYGLPDSLAVEFDTWQNSPYADPNGNHIAIQSCGLSANTPDHSAGCTLGIRSDLGVTIADGASHTVSISYVPGSFTVALDGEPTLAVPLQIQTELGLPDGQAWVGLAAATGGDSEEADILNWSFQAAQTSDTPEPATSSAVGVALIGIGLIGGRCRRPSAPSVSPLLNSGRLEEGKGDRKPLADSRSESLGI